MEIKEAIDILRHIGGSYGDVSKYYNAIQMAISALEKQIAKPPKEAEGYEADGFWRFDMPFCPTCGLAIDPIEHHCQCGQRIDCSDWSE